MIFECSCVDGFTGDFCEFKTEQDHLLFFHSQINGPNHYILNADERLIGGVRAIDEDFDNFGSCSTVFYGEAMIFGGWNSIDGMYFNRQVQ